MAVSDVTKPLALGQLLQPDNPGHYSLSVNRKKFSEKMLDSPVLTGNLMNDSNLSPDSLTPGISPVAKKTNYHTDNQSSCQTMGSTNQKKVPFREDARKNNKVNNEKNSGTNTGKNQEKNNKEENNNYKNKNTQKNLLNKHQGTFILNHRNWSGTNPNQDEMAVDDTTATEEQGKPKGILRKPSLVQAIPTETETEDGSWLPSSKNQNRVEFTEWIHKLPTGAPNREFYSRYNLKLHLVKSDEPVQELRKKLASVIDHIRKEDKDLVIIPWHEQQAPFKKIRQSSDLPSSVGDLQQYFDRARPAPTGGDIWCCCWIGHNKPFETILSSLSWWFRQNSCGLYRRPLQCASSRCLGWLLWSDAAIDKDALAQEIYQLTEVRVGLLWRIISSGTKGKMDEASKVRALHIDLDSKTYSTDKLKLQNLFRADRSSGWPLGIRMRLVPDMAELLNKHAREKAIRLRTKQAVFSTKSVLLPSDQIANLDYAPAAVGTTLRDICMSFKSAQFPDKPLFHSIAQGFRNMGTVFTVLPKFEEEAQTKIASLIPYLRYLSRRDSNLQKGVMSFFHPEAVESMKNAEWDDEKKCVVNQCDDLLDSLLDGEIDCDYFGLEDDDSSLSQAATSAVETLPSDSELDSDTVSTFHPSHRKQPTSDSSSRVTKKKSQHSRSSSVNSNDTEGLRNRIDELQRELDEWRAAPNINNTRQH